MTENRKLTDEEIWELYKEPCECKNCLNYEYIDEVVGWQCCYADFPPCIAFD